MLGFALPFWLKPPSSPSHFVLLDCNSDGHDILHTIKLIANAFAAWASRFRWIALPFKLFQFIVICQLTHVTLIDDIVPHTTLYNATIESIGLTWIQVLAVDATT